MASLPKRTLEHQTDEVACKLVESFFNCDWIMRDITNRDYGIDKICERFDYDTPTGELLLLQIKGTSKPIDKNNPRFSIETKTLLYSELFAVPFLLVYCETNEPNHCYYVWLQEYIRIILNKDNPNWKSQETNTIYFPKDNRLDLKSSEKHLKFISKLTNQKDYYIDFVNTVISIPYTVCNHIDDFLTQGFMRESITNSLKLLKEANYPLSILSEDIKLDFDLDKTIAIGESLLKQTDINKDCY